MASGGDVLIAVPICQGRVSPVFDVATRLLLVRLEGRAEDLLGHVAPALEGHHRRLVREADPEAGEDRARADALAAGDHQRGRWLTPVQGDVGFPDLVLARQGRLIFAELKREGRKPTPPQQGWLEVLATCAGVEVYLWTPADWGEIVRILR